MPPPRRRCAVLEAICNRLAQQAPHCCLAVDCKRVGARPSRSWIGRAQALTRSLSDGSALPWRSEHGCSLIARAGGDGRAASTIRFVASGSQAGTSAHLCPEGPGSVRIETSPVAIAPRVRPGSPCSEAQIGSRRLSATTQICKQEVTGSIPVGSIDSQDLQANCSRRRSAMIQREVQTWSLVSQS